MTSQAGKTVSGQSAGLGPWSEAAGHHSGRARPGTLAPQSDALSLHWRCGSWGEEKRLCPRAPQLHPAPPSPRAPPATSAPGREATARGLTRPRRSARSPVSVRPEAGAGPSKEGVTSAFRARPASLRAPWTLLGSLRLLPCAATRNSAKPEASGGTDAVPSS